MSTREPSAAELLAAAVGLALAGRTLIEATNGRNRAQLVTTLDALRENLAVMGGSLLVLADRLGCEAELRRLVDEGQARLAAFQACQGLEGRA